MKIPPHHDAADDQELLADAQGGWAHVPLEHFLRTPVGRAAGEAWREQLGLDG